MRMESERLTSSIVLEVVAESFQTLEKKDNSANHSSMENQMPPNFGTTNPMDISDDDLPF